MSKILIVGNKGSMGTRYTACLKFLNQDVVGIDEGEPWHRNVDRVIIATPTDTHVELCKKAIGLRIPFLVEKPLDRDPDKIEEVRTMATKYGVLGNMVCNWRFLPKVTEARQNKIYYDYYNTGRDGVAWDCIQLIYLDQGRPQIKTESPFFDVRVNGNIITQSDINKSYVQMLKSWLDLREGVGFVPGLWDLRDAREATIKVINYLAEEGGDGLEL